MVLEQVSKSCQDGSVHHHDLSNTTKSKAAEDSSPMLGGPSYRQIFKSRALYPMLVIASVQVATVLFDKLQVKALFHDVVMKMPSTVETYTVGLTLVAAALTCLAYYFVFVPGPVLMLDFSCFKPDDQTKVSKQLYVEKAKKSGFFTEKSLDFQEKVLDLSGLGDETYAPPSTLLEPVDRSLKATHAEAQMCIFGVADEIFAQGIVKPQDVSILVLNCSLYSPVPSLAAMVVNKYKMRKDIDVFNLGGMGCSAGLIAVDLAAKLLQGRRNSYALVISTEIISAQFGYPGNQRSMMVGNCLFRAGASGLLLSNRRGNIKPYVPDFKKAVSHFAIHPGGRAVLEGVAESLELDAWCMEPSKMTLHRFGNTSSSSVWYVMAYLEAKGRVKQGDTVWQIALGSGLKCNSVIWKSLRPSQNGPSKNCWATFIDKYPMEISPQPETPASK